MCLIFIPRPAPTGAQNRGYRRWFRQEPGGVSRGYGIPPGSVSNLFDTLTGRKIIPAGFMLSKACDPKGDSFPDIKTGYPHKQGKAILSADPGKAAQRLFPQGVQTPFGQNKGASGHYPDAPFRLQKTLFQRTNKIQNHNKNQAYVPLRVLNFSIRSKVPEIIASRFFSTCRCDTPGKR